MVGVGAMRQTQRHHTAIHTATHTATSYGATRLALLSHRTALRDHGFPVQNALILVCWGTPVVDPCVVSQQRMDLRRKKLEMLNRYKELWLPSLFFV